MIKDILIVGAGPTGLVLALWLTKQGVSVRIIDKDHGPGETSRAMAVQARTLELYRQLDLADKTVEAGHKNPSINLWVSGKRKAHVSFGDAGADLTPYPYLLIYPQDQHEKLLIEKLHSMGVVVERETELIDFESSDKYVSARLRLPDQSEAICKVHYLAGCDGARSFVRHKIGAGFAGGTYKQIFYVADVEVIGLEPKNETHIALDSSDFVAVLSYGNNGESRLIGTVQDERAERADALIFDDVEHEAIDKLGLTVKKVNWFSTYRVHHRVAEHFRSKRIFLLGDAAHVHSPAGGQGMNTGIADAINLSWKLAAVLQGKAPEGLLDSYEIERQAFARKLVHSTDRIFSFISAEGSFANFIRTHIAPIAANLISRIKSVRKFMFRMISQTNLNYRNSPLSKGTVGRVQGGDRLPWVATSLVDNYESLRNIHWQIHIYGVAQPDIRLWCEQNGIVLHVFEWDPKYKKAGLTQDAAYLLRPDTYVAFVDAHPTPAALEHYLITIGYLSV
ncbi:MAG: FAD-dependent oxidoreductase [Legionella sp.]|nr:FAD-dependent oxidoreductase [Legionella sp.]